MANVPRSEPSTDSRDARSSISSGTSPGLLSDVSDDTSSARDDGLAWFKTAFGAFVYDKGYRQAFSMLGFPGPELGVPHGAVPASAPPGES